MRILLLSVYLVFTIQFLNAQQVGVRELKPFVNIEKGMYAEAIDSLKQLISSDNNVYFLNARINAFIKLNELDKALYDCELLERKQKGSSAILQANYRFSKENKLFFVNDSPVIIYHFSSLKRIAEKKWNANTIIYMASVKSVLLEMYINYIKEVEINDRSDKFAVIQLSKSVWKRIFYRIMQLFLNEKIRL